MWSLRLRYPLRTLARDPGFVSVVVLVLSLGIAANTTVFTVIDQVVFNPLPYRDPARLAMLWESNPSLGEPAGSRVPAAWANFTEWRSQSRSFEAIEALEQAGYNLTGQGNPEHLMAVRATGGYFQMLGTNSDRGRTLTPNDTAPGANRVVVITNSFSRSHFAERDPLGQKLLLDGVPHTIVGVLPKKFHLPLFFQGAYEYKPDVWVPLPPTTAADPQAAFKSRRLFVSARLKSNASVAQAQAEMTAIANRLAKADPNLNAAYSVNVVPLKTENADPDLSRSLYILWAAAIVVLLLGCANLAGLMLIRAMNKQKDLAIMGALGAPRRVQLAPIVVESILLVLVAATLALVGSYAGVGAIRAFEPGDIAGAQRLSLDARSFLFSGLAFVVCVAIFGLFPAWLGTRRPLTDALKNERGSSGARLGSRTRRCLVAVEVAIALVLAIGATLLVRSFQKILEVDPGFSAQNVLTARISLAPPRYNSADERSLFCQKLLDGVRTIPGAQTASLADNFPLYSIRYTSFEIEGRAFSPASPPTSDYANVTADFFETMGTPLRSGRYFTPDDMQEKTSNVVIVNESLARKFWPGQGPVGSHIRFIAPHREPGPWRRVVGVVADFRQFNIDTPARPEMFWPAREFPQMTLAVRTAAAPATALASLQRTIAEIDKEEPLSDVQTLQQMVDHSISQRRFDMFLLSGFAGLSILLALVGVYGLVSYNVSSRTREIGIRLTLGAQRRHIFLCLIIDIFPFAAGGIVAGVALSLLARKLIASLLFGISALDPVIYVSLPIVLTALLLLACVIPALRASRIEPARVLRQE